VGRRKARRIANGPVGGKENAGAQTQIGAPAKNSGSAISRLSKRLEPVAQGVDISPFQPALPALAFPGLDQVFETSGPLRSGLTAFGASPFPLHSQLVLSLPGNPQARKFVLNGFSHRFFR
jgi:hypothetical protein